MLVADIYQDHPLVLSLPPDTFSSVPVPEFRLCLVPDLQSLTPDSDLPLMFLPLLYIHLPNSQNPNQLCT